MRGHVTDNAVSSICIHDNMKWSSRNCPVMPSYRFNSSFPAVFHLVFFYLMYTSVLELFSLLSYVKSTERFCDNIIQPGHSFRLGKKFIDNGRFIQLLCNILLVSILSIWLPLLLLRCGDIHSNPGPFANSSLDSESISSHNEYSCSSNFTGLSIVQFNVQSIQNKIDLLQANLSSFDILCFTETWLKDNILSDAIMMSNFRTPERKDRQDGYGGVAIYLSDKLHYSRRRDLEPNGLECIWVDVHLQNKHMLVGCFYRPPSSNQHYLSLVISSISLARDTGINDIVVTGDFNLNVLNQVAFRKVESICNQFDLYQCIKEPTHYTENSSTLLDLLFVSNPECLASSGVGDPFLDYDLRYHCPVYGIFRYQKPSIKTYKRTVWFYDRGDFELLRNKANMFNWLELMNDDIDVFCQNITNKIMTLTEECIPHKVITVRPSEPPWLNSIIKRKIRSRKRHYRKAKRTNNQSDWRRFRTIRNEVTSLIRSSKKAYYNSLSTKLKSELSSRDWWKTLKSFIGLKSKPSIPPLVFKDSIIFDEYGKANLLNIYFKEQASIDDSFAPVPSLPISSNSLHLPTFSPSDVEDILKTLQVNKASGPDGVSNRVLKELSHELSIPLCELFTRSLYSCQFPVSWKRANVCAIYKKDDPSLPSNYRPVSLLSNISKVFERLIFKCVHNYLVDTRFFTPFQSGFTPNDSTTNQLLYIYDTFCKALDEGKEVRAVFFDISKAFDRVWHAGLLAKLKSAGLSESFVAWFSGYLSNREQRVVIPGATSSWASITAGVPQGSILGPLLFLIYINDIVKQVDSHIRLFADDTSLFIKVDGISSTAETLNSDINKISLWAKSWLVSFNPSKTESVIFSRKSSNTDHPPLTMNEEIISEFSSHKHLGVILTKDCSWHSHIDSIKEKAWKRISVMRKLKFQLDRSSLENIYLSFIRPILEFSDVIWDNCSYGQKQELEKIQHEAARIVTGCTQLVSLTSLYHELGWSTLESRRKLHKLILFYKMINNLVPSYLSSLVTPRIGETSRYLLRNSNNMQNVFARTQLYYNSFLPSTVRAWNELPDNVRSLPSLNLFKKAINGTVTLPPKHFTFGNRREQVLHTRLRTGCSALNADLYAKNIIESSLCRCGDVETAAHFFLTCPNYSSLRAELLSSISRYSTPNINLILFGDTSLAFEINIAIFRSVHKFILNSKRFE